MSSDSQLNINIKSIIIAGASVILIAGIIVYFVLRSKPTPASAVALARSFNLPMIANSASGEEKKQFLISSDDEGNLLNTSLISNEMYPTGSILLWSVKDTIPPGWLLCDGNSYTVTDYPELYKIIQNQYGGDNTKFNVPNLGGRVVIGLGTTERTKTFGLTGGEENVTLNLNQIPNHKHSIVDTYSTGVIWKYPPYSKPTDVASTQIINSTRATNETGENHPHNNMQPFLILKFIIKI